MPFCMEFYTQIIHTMMKTIEWLLTLILDFSDKINKNGLNYTKYTRAQM